MGGGEFVVHRFQRRESEADEMALDDMVFRQGPEATIWGLDSGIWTISPFACEWKSVWTPDRFLKGAVGRLFDLHQCDWAGGAQFRRGAQQHGEKAKFLNGLIDIRQFLGDHST
jgi:hypothetical protein